MGKGSKNFVVNRGQGSRIGVFNRVNNIDDFNLGSRLGSRTGPRPVSINNRSVFLIDHFFEPRSSNMIKYLTNIGYIPDTIDVEIVSNTSSLETILDKYYNNGYRLFFGTQKSSVFIGLIPWFEKYSDTFYLNSGATTYTPNIDDYIPNNMIRISCNVLDNVNFIVKKIVYNFHQFFDLNHNSIFNNFFNHVDDFEQNGQVFNQIVYICDSSAVTGTGQNYIDTFNSVINDYCPGAVSFKSFVLNVSKDTENNSFEFNKELDTLLTENPIDGNNFSESLTKSIFVVKCTNDSNFQTILNYFSKKEYYHNVIIFNEKFLNMNTDVPFNSKYELPYSFILSGGFSELGYKLSKKIFGDYNIGGEILSFIDTFTFLPRIYSRVIEAGTPMTKMIEYLTTIGSIDKNEWHVKSSYLYELKNVYNESTRLFDFYPLMKIFRKKFNSDSIGTTPDESWIPTAISSYPGEVGAVSYSSNNTNYNNSNSAFVNKYLSGVSMLFTTTQEITDYTSQLDSFFKASPSPNATPSVFGIWKCLTNTSWAINSSAISNTIAINVTVPSQALIEGSSCNKNYWIHVYNGPISYTYNSYDVRGTLIGTGSDTVTIDFDMTYSPDNYVLFFDKGNNYNGVRGPLRVHFTLYANNVINKEYRMGDVITVSSSSLGTNVNVSIDRISSDGFTLGVTRFENENTNGITSTILKQNAGVVLSLESSSSIATMGVNPDITNVSNNSLNMWSQNGCYYLTLVPSGLVVAYDYRTRLSFWSSSSYLGATLLRFRVSNNSLIIEVLGTDGTINTIVNYSVSSNLLVYPLQFTITNDRNIAIINANGHVLWSENSRVKISLENGDFIGNTGNYGSMYSLNGTYNLALDSTGLCNFLNVYGNTYNISSISQGWSAVYNQFKNNTTSYAWNNYKWIWNASNSAPGSPGVPAGTVNFYTSYTNTRSTDIIATLYYSVDDTLNVYMNGIKLNSSTVPYNVVWSVTITLKAGTTSNFKFVATNAGGPAGLIFWCLENGNTNDATNTLFFSNNTNTTSDSLYSISNSTATSLKFSYTTTSTLTFALGLYNSAGIQVYNILPNGSFLNSTTFDVENNKLIELSFVAPYTCKLSNNGDLVIVDANNNKYWALGKANKTTVTQDSYAMVSGVSTLTSKAVTGISSVNPRQGDYATIHSPVNPLYSGATATISTINPDKSIKVQFYDEDDIIVRSKFLNVKPALRSQLVTDSGDTRGQNFMLVSDLELFKLTSANGYFSSYIGNDCILRVKDNRTGRQMWMSSSLALVAGETIRKCNGLKIDNETGSLYIDVISENVANVNSQSIYQTVNLTANVNYTLEFYANMNNNSLSPITVNIRALNNALQPTITFTFTPTNSGLQLFTQVFSVVTNGTFTITFSPNFPNISLKNGATISSEHKVGNGCVSLTASSSQYVQITDAFTTASTGMSFSFWFRSNNTSTWGRIFDFGNGSWKDNIIAYVNGGNLGFSVYFENTSTQINNVIPSINNNNWHHITWTLDTSKNWKIYLDGKLYISYANMNYPKTIQRSLNYIGKSNWSSDPYFNGAIDDFRYYSRVLTSSEVTDIYTVPFKSTIYPDIPMYISFDPINWSLYISILQNISINNQDKYYLFQNAGDNTSSYSLNMQDDGNLCLYKNASNGTVTSLWSTGTWQTDSWKSTDGAIQAFEYFNQYLPSRLISTNGFYYLSIDVGKLGIMNYANGGYNWVDNSSFKHIGKPFFYTGQPGVGLVANKTIYPSGTLWQNASNSATGGYWNSFYNNVMNSFSFSNSDGYNLVDKVSPIWVSPNSTGINGSSGGSSGTYDFKYRYNNTTGKTIPATLWVTVLEICDVYVNEVFIKTLGGTSSSSWNNFFAYDFNLNPGDNNTFNFLKTYNSSGRCGLVFMCFPRNISSCDLLLDNTGDANGFGKGNLLVHNVTVLAEDGTTVTVPGISDLNPYAITNLKNDASSSSGPYTMSFNDDGSGGSNGAFLITNSAGGTIFSSKSSSTINASLPVPADRRGILNIGVKLYAQHDESELHSFLWSPSGYSFFGVHVDTVAKTQTICIFDARFTKPVYTFYTNSYTTLTSCDAISYLMVSSSGAIVAYNLLGSVLWKTVDISGYSNYILTMDDSNMLSIIGNNLFASSVTLATYLQTWGTFGNTLLSNYTGSAYYGGRVLTSSSGDYILSLENGSLNINNVIDTSYSGSSSGSSSSSSSSSSSGHVKDIYNYTLYSQLYKYTGSNPGSVHVRFMPNGTYIVCEWPTSYLMWGDWFYPYPGRPAQSYSRLNDGNWVYMYYDGTYTKMVSDTGEAKYYTGQISLFNPNNWSTYTLAYDSASQQSHYNLNLVPLHTFGTSNIGIPGYKLVLSNTGELAIYDTSIPRAAAIDCCSVSAGSSAVYNQFKNNTTSYAWNNYRWIWNVANSSTTSVPVGTVNFYTTYTNTRSSDITATLYYSVDDTLNVYMDGKKLTSSTVPYNVVWSVTITLKAGITSFFKFVATNGGGGAGLIFWCLENGNTNDATNTLFFSNPNTVYCSDGINMNSDEFGIQTWTSGTSYSEIIPYPNYKIDTSDIPENVLVSNEFTFKIPSSIDDTEEYTKIYSQNRLYYLRLEKDGSLAIYLSISKKMIWSNGRPYSGTNNAARLGFVYGSDGNGAFGLFDSKGLSYGNTIPVLKDVLYAFYLGNDRILRLVGSNGSTVVFNP